MSHLSAIIASLVLSAVLPVSVAALYAMIMRHVQLSPASAIDGAAVDRFDSEAERAAYHADLHARQRVREAATQACYRHIMEAALAAMDPRLAAPYRRAIGGPQALRLETTNNGADASIDKPLAATPSPSSDSMNGRAHRSQRPVWPGNGASA
jgi:hypothetical protein